MRGLLAAFGYLLLKKEAMAFGYDIALDIARICTANDIKIRAVFDIGAHDGSVSTRFLKSFPAASVHAFEPHPTNHDLLGRISNPRFSAHRFAVSDRSGSAAFYVYSEPSNDGPNSAPAAMNNTLLPHQHDRSIQVQCTTIDEFCAANAIGVVDLIKIDTEGHDAAVLRGARRTLPTARFVACEFSSLMEREGRDDSLCAIARELEPIGFSFVATYPVHTTTNPYRTVADALFFAESRAS